MYQHLKEGRAKDIRIITISPINNEEDHYEVSDMRFSLSSMGIHIYEDRNSSYFEFIPFTNILFIQFNGVEL